MPQSHAAREFLPARRQISSIAVALTALVFATACNDNDTLRANGTTSDAGAAGAVPDDASESGAGASAAGTPHSNAGHAGSGAVAGHAGSGEEAGGGGIAGAAGSVGIAGSAGSSGVAGSAGSSGVAGSAGSGGIAGSAGSGGIAGSAGSGGVVGTGGTGQTTNCTVGGALFVVGNYADAGGNLFILRTAAKAATFAVIPAGSANPSKPPRLFLVNRVCAPGAALIAGDGNSNYRVDLIQAGSQLTVCMSAAVPTLEAALLLPPADASHSASTGCAGHAFDVYTAGAL